MNQEQALSQWGERFHRWVIASAELGLTPSRDAEETIAREHIADMSQTLVDMLLRSYAPNQVANLIAHGAYLTFADMVRHYVKEPGEAK